MKIYEIKDYIYTIDTETGNEPEIISSYILNTEKPAVIESGPSSIVNSFLSIADEIGINVSDIEFIFLTHIHLDHGGGVGLLSKIFKNAKVIVHPYGVKHLINPEKLWNASKTILGKIAELYGAPVPVNSERIIAPKDGETISLGNERIKVIYSPGHASHHISYFLEESSTLFPGDSAGISHDGYVIPTTPPPCDFDKSIESIKKMRVLNPKYIAYTHFGLSDANNLLEKIEEKISEWRKIAVSSKSVEDMHNTLLDVDEDYQYFWKKMKDSKFADNFFRLSLEGFLSERR